MSVCTSVVEECQYTLEVIDDGIAGDVEVFTANLLDIFKPEGAVPLANA